MSVLLNDILGDDFILVCNLGLFVLQLYVVDVVVENFFFEVIDFMFGCIIEQLEQINCDFMDEIWWIRYEWNWNVVLDGVVRVFNSIMSDIEGLQGMGFFSQ